MSFLMYGSPLLKCNMLYLSSPIVGNLFVILVYINTNVLYAFIHMSLHTLARIWVEQIPRNATIRPKSQCIFNLTISLPNFYSLR